jgi:hypothetical protein
VRCDAAEFLEFHHIDPWARTGTHSVDGIALRCRAHNQYEARRVFGAEHMARIRKREGAESETPVLGTAGSGVSSSAAAQVRDRVDDPDRSTRTETSVPKKKKQLTPRML